MTLKILLKRGEYIYVGMSKIGIESDSIAKILIEGNAPLIREKDYLPAEKAGTPARRVYQALQRAYLEENFEKYRDEYFRNTGELIAAKPGAAPFLSKVNEKLAAQELYPALKAAIKLVQYDEGFIAEGEASSHWSGF